MGNSTIIIVFCIGLLVIVWYYWLRRGQEREERPDPSVYINGLRAILRGQDEQAYAYLKQTIAADTNNVDAFIQLGNLLRRLNKPDQALKIHRDLTYRGNLSAEEKKEILLALYYDYKALDNEVTGIKAINEIIELYPDDIPSLKMLLRWLEKTGEWKEAGQIRRHLDKLENVDSGRRLALYKVFEGYALGDKGDRHRARLFYKEALHIDKTCLAACLSLGDSYFDEKRLEDAIRYWMRIIELRPEAGHVVFERLKKGYFETGQYGQYADTLTKLLQACPEHLTARLELAYFLEKKGERSAAREHYVIAQDNHPESLMAKLGAYRLNREDGREEMAEAILRGALKLAVKKEARSYTCGECGLVMESKVWLCPRCKAVDSFPSAK